MYKSKRAISLIWSILISLALFSCSVNEGNTTPLVPSITPHPSFTPEPTATASITIEPVITETFTPEPTFTSTPIPAFPFDYQVQKGDTLGQISVMFSVPIALIAIENNIADPNLIIVGQTLRIPDPNSTPSIISKTEKQILVILSEQKAYAYENGEIQKEFLVSTGVAEHPTVQGNFKIYIKLESTRMKGDDYDLANVPWTMYFFEGYGAWHLLA